MNSFSKILAVKSFLMHSWKFLRISRMVLLEKMAPNFFYSSGLLFINLSTKVTTSFRL